MKSNDWERVRLGDILEALIDYRGKTPRKVSHGIPLITAKIVKNGFIQEPDEFIATEDYATWMVRGYPKIGDVVLTMEAPLGEVAQITNEHVALAQRIVTLRGETGILDNTFLKYFLKSDIGQARLKERETGTTVTGIKQSELRLIEIDLPPFENQVRIASMLSYLDDKIELNRQTNDTLEAIAEAIYKDWFVHFHFPNAVDGIRESELGLLPQGWRIGRLGEVCEFAYGKGLVSEKRVPGIYPVVGSSGVVDYHNEYLVNGPGVVIGRKGTIGEVTWVHENFFPIDTTFYIRDLLEVNGLFFHYFLLKQQDFRKISTDSAVPGLNRNQAYQNMVTIPDINLVAQFNNLVKPIFESINNLSEQSSSLIQIRDCILPKLLNGEIVI